jgi:hypothetical protein
MAYEPSTVKPGEQIRFVLRNVGKEDHEFLNAQGESRACRSDEEASAHGARRQRGKALGGVCLSVILPAPCRYS